MRVLIKITITVTQIYTMEVYWVRVLLFFFLHNKSFKWFRFIFGWLFTCERWIQVYFCCPQMEKFLVVFFVLSRSPYCSFTLYCLFRLHFLYLLTIPNHSLLLFSLSIHLYYSYSFPIENIDESQFMQFKFVELEKREFRYIYHFCYTDHRTWANEIVN